MNKLFIFLCWCLIYQNSYAQQSLDNTIKEGCLSGDCTNGMGEYYYSNGFLYKGYFVGGKRKGKGILKTTNHEIHSDQWDEANNDAIILGISVHKFGGIWIGEISQINFTEHGLGKKYYKTGKPYFEGRIVMYKNGTFVSGHPSITPEKSYLLREFLEKNHPEIKKTTATNKTVSNSVNKEQTETKEEKVKRQRAFWDKKLGVSHSGTSSGSFDFNKFQKISIAIAKQHKELEEIYLKALRNQKKCYESHTNGRYNIYQMRQCEKQFLKDINRISTYNTKFITLFKESQFELKKARCSIKDIHYKFSLYESRMSLLDQGYKELYDNTYILVSRLNAISSDQQAQELFKKNTRDMDATYRSIKKIIDEYGAFYDQWSRKIKDGCK